MSSGRNLSLITSLLLAACGGGGGDGGGGGGGPPPTPPPPPPPSIEPTLASIQDNVFTPICTTCHAGAAAPNGLRLEEGMSHAMLVNVPSLEVPALLRVEPGNPDDSYLVQKIEGTAAVGGRMPLGGDPLSADTIAAIRQWITDGAVASAVATASAARLQLLAPSPEADIRPEDAPPVSELLVAADQALDGNLLGAGTVILQASGGDGSFREGNEVAIAHRIVMTQHDPSVFRLIPSKPLAVDRYRLKVSGTTPLAVSDLDAVVIDGDADGTTGDDFVAEFSAGPVR